MSSLYRSVRPLSLVVVLLTVAGFLVAQPAHPSGASVAASDQPLAQQSQLFARVAAFSIREAIADPTTPVVASVGFTPVAAMPPRAEHAEPAAPVSTPTPAASGAPASSNTGQRAAANSDTPTGYGCAAALSYLAAHAAPGFTFKCPGYADGNQAMTCVNHAPECPGQKIIAIAVPCAAAYMNEAHNSYVLIGQASGVDPYGYCH